MKKNFIWPVIFFFLWLTFSLAAASYLDPDFGWHLKTGEWIWQNRAVPKVDLFSYTMPDYPWVSAEWLGEVFIYRFYPVWGYVGLAIFFGLIAAITFWLVKGPVKKAGFFAPLLLASLAEADYMAVRPKMFGLFFAGVSFWLLGQSYKRPKMLLVLPLVFLFWANFHPSFPVVFLIMIIMSLTDFWQGKVRHGKDVLMAGLLSFLTTLVNPYGLTLYREIKNTLFSQNLHFTIVEWLPYTTFRLSMIIYTGAFLAFIYLFRKHFSLFDKFTSLLLLVLGFSSNRLMIFFFLFTLPLFTQALQVFYHQVHKTVNFKLVWRFRRYFVVIFILLAIVTLANFPSRFRLYNESAYPVGAVSYLRSNLFDGNLFSHYNWGGYLIWQLPEKKVFIDGRMAIWEQNGYSAFEEERAIYNNKINFDEIAKKYRISHVLLPISTKQSDIFQRIIDIFFKEKDNGPGLRQHLEQSGWQEVYKDDVAIVLAKND